MVQLIYILDNAGVDGVGRGVQAVLFVKIRVAGELGRLFLGVALVCIGQILPAQFPEQCRAFLPALDGQKLIGILVFGQIGVFKAGPQPLVPAEKAQGGIGAVDFIGVIQPLYGLVQQAQNPLRIARVFVIIDKAQKPVELIAFDAVGPHRRIAQVFQNKIVVAEGHQGGRLGGVGVPRPGVAVAPVHQDGGQIVLFQIGPHVVGRRIPDFVEHFIVAVKTALVVDGLGLADQPDAGDGKGLIEFFHIDKAEADALVQLVVKLQPVGVAVFYRRGRLGGGFGAAVDKSGLVVFAHAQGDFAGQIRAVDFQPAGELGPEIHADGARAVHRDFYLVGGDGLEAGKAVGGLGVIGLGFLQENLQGVFGRGVIPAVGHQRIGGCRLLLSGKAAVGYVFIGFPDGGLSPDGRVGRCGDNAVQSNLS